MYSASDNIMLTNLLLEVKWIAKHLKEVETSESFYCLRYLNDLVIFVFFADQRCELLL
jgi:hypothetical protein